MGLTKRTLFTLGALIWIAQPMAISGQEVPAQQGDLPPYATPPLSSWSQRTLLHPESTERSSVRAPLQEFVLGKEDNQRILSATELKKLRPFYFTPKNPNAISVTYTIELARKLTYPETHKDFHGHGTIDGLPLNDFIYNQWARDILKPALSRLTTPFERTEPSATLVNSIVFSPNSAQLAFARQHDIYTWSLQKDTSWSLFQKLSKHPEIFHSLAFSPDNRHLAANTHTTTIYIWSLQPNTTWGEPQELAGQTKYVSALVFSPNGNHLATASDDNSISIWTLQPDNTWQQPQILKGHTDAIRFLSFNPQSNQLASGSRDTTVRIWTFQADNKTWQQQPQTLKGHTNFISSLSFSPNGIYLATASDDSLVHIWTLQKNASWKHYQLLTGHENAITSITFNPNSTQLATASEDNSVRIWTLQPDTTWKLSQVLTGHTNAVTSVAFNHNGTQLASTSKDATIRIWTLQPDNTWGQPQVITDFTSPLASAFFSPDGNYLASKTNSLEVQIWRQIDLIDTENIAEKILLLQILDRGERNFSINKYHLYTILGTFSDKAQKYLFEKYNIPSKNKFLNMKLWLNKLLK